MLHLARRAREPEEIDPAHLPAVMEGFEQAKRREFATGDEVEAALRLFRFMKFGLFDALPKTSPPFPLACAGAIRRAASPGIIDVPEVLGREESLARLQDQGRVRSASWFQSGLRLNSPLHGTRNRIAYV